MLRLSLVVMASVVLFGCSGSAGGTALTPATAAGSWAGSWNNTTFSSTGAAKATITTDEATKKIEFKLDLDGNVFGGTNPPEETFSGSYDGTAYTVSGSSTLFGMLTLKVDKDGKMTGSAKPTRGDVTFDGTASQTEMKLNYTLKDSSGDVKGTMTLTKAK